MIPLILGVGMLAADDVLLMEHWRQVRRVFRKSFISLMRKGYLTSTLRVLPSEVRMMFNPAGASDLYTIN